MQQDRYGNELSTVSATARDAYVQAVDLFLAAAPNVDDAFRGATAADERFALAYLGLARNRQSNGDGKGARAAVEAARAVAHGLNAREASQLDVIGRLVDGDAAGGYQAARRHLAEWPGDPMVAQTCLGVFGLIGFSGEAGREAENLALATQLAPAYGDDWWFLCQLSFAQMEAGRRAPAEATIERSLAGNPRNANAAHYRAHLYYENGETEAGYAFLDEWRKPYEKSALMHCHIAWHLALWALAKGDVETMWRIADADVAPGGALGPPLNVLTDTAALLYRAQLAGVDVAAARWRAISDYAAKFFPKPGLAFADVHAAVAHAMAGEIDALETIIAGARGPAADVVAAVAEGFRAIAAEDWAAADRSLTLAMADHERVGGSRAQRDLIEYALASTLLRQGDADAARRLLAIDRPHTATETAIKGLYN